jgi:hypothetical protein
LVALAALIFPVTAHNLCKPQPETNTGWGFFFGEPATETAADLKRLSLAL